MRIWTAIGVLGLVGCATGEVVEPTCAPGWQEAAVQVGDVVRGYRLFVPDGADAAPISLLFHGLGGDAVDIVDRSGMDAEAEARGALLVVPHAANNFAGAASWGAGYCCAPAQEWRDDEAFARAAIEQLSTLSCADTTRVFATGESNGGMMAYHLACQASDVVVGAGVVIGALSTHGTACRPDHDVAVLHIHGDEDDVLFTNGASDRGLITIPPAGAVEHFSEQNGCTGSREEVRGNAACTVYTGCGAPTEYCLTEGLGHDWPIADNAGFEGAAMLFDFFEGI